MNHDEIDVMKLTPEDYLKMLGRCKNLSVITYASMSIFWSLKG